MSARRILAMADDTDVLLKFCEQQWMEAKQAEDQRAVITNIILLVTSALLGLITQNGLSSNMLPLTILIFLLGLYGVVTSQKLYERHQFHIQRLQSWRKRIDELHPNAQLNKLREEAVAKHKTIYPKLYGLRLHLLWLVMHSVISLIGVILTLIVIIK
jgi:hypothetical protein